MVRQFYDVARWFRIVPDQSTGMAEDFVQFDNTGLAPIPQMTADGVITGFRVPEFDLEITAEKANPYRKMEQNELALSFYKMGFFAPQQTDQALACLRMMDFDHKQDVIDMIEENGTIAQQLAMFQQLAIGMAQRYGDTQAMQVIQQAMMGQGGAPIGMGGDVDPAEVANQEIHSGEASHVQRARDQARSSTEVS